MWREGSPNPIPDCMFRREGHEQEEKYQCEGMGVPILFSHQCLDKRAWNESKMSANNVMGGKCQCHSYTHVWTRGPGTGEGWVPMWREYQHPSCTSVQRRDLTLMIGEVTLGRRLGVYLKNNFIRINYTLNNSSSSNNYSSNDACVWSLVLVNGGW